MSPPPGWRKVVPVVLPACLFFLAGPAQAAAQENTAVEEARLLVDPLGQDDLPTIHQLAGSVSWRTTPRLMGELVDVGLGGGWSRRMFPLHDYTLGRYIGEDIRNAKAVGIQTWLTVVGTPLQFSPYPDRLNNEYGTGLPEFARYLPTDPLAWTDWLLNYLNDMWNTYGVLPDRIEIWNEIERPEWYAETLTQYVEFYAIVAARIREVYPEIQLGGPGLAGWRSAMGGVENALLTMVRSAALSHAPLDFVSWHHYGPGTELRFSQIVAQLDMLGAALEMPPFDTVVSEWNIAPSAEGAIGPEFDGSHAAANLATFYSTAARQGLDYNLFFLDWDEDNDSGITDLSGVSLGAITKHGIRKPVAHVMRSFLESAAWTPVPIEPPRDEYSLTAFGARNQNALRLIVANDVVSGSWVFTNHARMFGMVPEWLQAIWLAAGGPAATHQTLVAAGLTDEQATNVLAFMPLVLTADQNMARPRQISLEMLGSAPFQIQEIYRFNAAVNAPALQRNAILPELTSAFEQALSLGAIACATSLTLAGYPVTELDIIQHLRDYFTWAEQSGIPYGYAVIAWKVFQDVRRDAFLIDAPLLNALPGIQPQSETTTEAGITVIGRRLVFAMDPNSVIVLEITL